MADAPTHNDATVVWRGGTCRLDRALRLSFPEWGRSAVDEVISTRRVRVNSKIVWMSSWKVVPGDLVTVHRPPSAKPTGATTFDAAWLVADEGEYLVLDKPAGLRSEATRSGDTTPNLLSLLRNVFGDDVVLAHRLDRDTSGLILATRPGPIRARLNELFSTHTIEKRYVALVHSPNDFSDKHGTIDCLLAPEANRKDRMRVVDHGGKRAITDYEVVGQTDDGIRVSLFPRTGRTHQLRVQCALLGGPILGDVIYGPDGGGYGRLHLHADALTVPIGGVRHYSSPAPF